MSVEDRHEAPPTKWASLKSRERHRSRRVTATLIATCLAGFALVVQAPVAGAASHAAKRTPAVAIVPFAGDVFTTDYNNNLIQVDPRSTPASAPLYNLDGNPLGLTWGQWSSATASSLVKTVTKHGIDYTDFRIMLNGLIPSGVYSLFYRTFSPDSANPICPVVDPLIALPARFPQRRTPDPYSFVADSSGGGAFRARVAGRLMDAAAVQVVVIYHFDGNVYGPVPNQGESTPRCFPSFGVDAMRQFLIIQK